MALRGSGVRVPPSPPRFDGLRARGLFPLVVGLSDHGPPPPQLTLRGPQGERDAHHHPHTGGTPMTDRDPRTVTIPRADYTA